MTTTTYTKPYRATLNGRTLPWVFINSNDIDTTLIGNPRAYAAHLRAIEHLGYHAEGITVCTDCAATEGWDIAAAYEDGEISIIPRDDAHRVKPDYRLCASCDTDITD